MLKYQISILMVFRVFFSILYRYLLILIQYWEKTLNTIKVLIWYFSISNNIFFFILTSYLGNDILGNIYVPSKYSQNTFTPVCCHVCSAVCYSLKFWQTSPGLATPFFIFWFASRRSPAGETWRGELARSCQQHYPQWTVQAMGFQGLWVYRGWEKIKCSWKSWKFWENLIFFVTISLLDRRANN